MVSRHSLSRPDTPDTEHWSREHLEVGRTQSVPYPLARSASPSPDALRRGSLQPQHVREPRLPSITPHGIRLGTPVAREAAKSFWSMDMLRHSINKMAFYADRDYENHSQTSLGSLDSGYNSSVLTTPTTPFHLPPITVSAPSSPVCSSSKDQTRCESSKSLYTSPTPPLVLGPLDKPPPLLAARQHRRRRSSGAISPPHTTSHCHSQTLSIEGRGVGPSSRLMAAPGSKPVRRSSSSNSVYHRRRESLPVDLTLTVSGKKLSLESDHGFPE